MKNIRIAALLLALAMLCAVSVFASGEPSAAPSGEPAAAVEPGTYSDGVNTLVIADDMTFTMEKTGQNMEGTDFVLLVTGVVGADGSFTITGLYDGTINLMEVASADQVAADLASVESAYRGGKASQEPAGSASGEPSGSASGEASGSAGGRTQPATEAEYEAYEAYLRDYMTNYAGVGDGTFDEGARSMAIGELDGVGFGADVTQFPFEMYVTQFGALSFADWIAG